MSWDVEDPLHVVEKRRAISGFDGEATLTDAEGRLVVLFVVVVIDKVDEWRVLAGGDLPGERSGIGGPGGGSCTVRRHTRGWIMDGARKSAGESREGAALCVDVIAKVLRECEFWRVALEMRSVHCRHLEHFLLHAKNGLCVVCARDAEGIGAIWPLGREGGK